MARRTFFSFHYVPDVHRAWNVRNSWVTQDRDAAGFYDGSVFESKKRTSDDALKSFLTDGLSGTSVTAVLYGTNTAWRRWVRFELLKSFVQGKGILSVAIHSIRDLEQKLAAPGEDPLSVLGYEVTNSTIKFKEKLPAGTWQWAADVGAVSVSAVPYPLRNGDNSTLSTLFRTYDWAQNDGRGNIGRWIEIAASAAGR